ncbi:alpha 1,2-mannosyltransferase 2.4.1 [Myotisia sp. PD_48]|nr:alpha 1,2-mannosyltransferase 2.4.1 [Myotisia sp. PD_48]
MNGIPGRYLRYILFAILGIAILNFISSSSIPFPNPSALSSGIRRPHFGDQGKPGKQPSQQASTSPPLSSKSTPTTTAPVQKQSQKDDKPSNKPEDKPDNKPTDTPDGKSKEKPVDNPENILENKPGQKLPLFSVPGERVNATFVTLARNSDLWEILKSIRQVEDRFNSKYHYDWVFLNDVEFSDNFKALTSRLVSGTTHYGVVPFEHWSFPKWIDQSRAAEVRKEMKEKQVIYGDSISYRHMCRYESGFFFRHPLMQQFDYYWRVEPSVDYFCDIDFDPFKFMKDNKKKYSFVISLHEYKDTVLSLWDSVRKFMEKFPQHIAEDNNLEFISEDGGKSYNLCHFWSNFEIGDLNFFRSQKYLDYFDSLDQDGGFFYERWGDAPVHSIAAALLLNKDEIHFFNEIAYRHAPFFHCPTGEQAKLNMACLCKPEDNADWKKYSCTGRYFDVNKLEKPAEFEQEA